MFQCSQKGSNNLHWKGGVVIVSPSKRIRYRLIRKPDHPFARKNGYVAEHRLIMEKAFGRFLRHEEIIHHINGDTLDNRIANLVLTDRAKHAAIHEPENNIRKRARYSALKTIATELDERLKGEVL